MVAIHIYQVRRRLIYAVPAALAFIFVLALLVRGSSGTDQTSPTGAVPGRLPPPATGDAQGVVHDIFGDPVPFPVVQIGERKVTGSAKGEYHITEIPVGSYNVNIQAPGFRQRAFRYTVYEGNNTPRVKYASGLWPDDFAVDFHVFFLPERPERFYGLVGLANPSSMPIYVTSMRIEDAEGTLVQDFLGTIDDFQRFALVHAAARLVFEPDPAIIVPARGTIAHIELKPFTPGSGNEEAPFRLIITYGDRNDYRSGAYKQAVKEVSPQPEEDLNPHAP